MSVIAFLTSPRSMSRILNWLRDGDTPSKQGSAAVLDAQYIITTHQAVIISPTAFHGGVCWCL